MMRRKILSVYTDVEERIQMGKLKKKMKLFMMICSDRMMNEILINRTEHNKQDQHNLMMICSRMMNEILINRTEHNKQDQHNLTNNKCVLTM